MSRMRDAPSRVAEAETRMYLKVSASRSRIAQDRRKVVAAAVIEIHNYDGWRQILVETGKKVSPAAQGVLRITVESRWRRPEKWDKECPRKRYTWCPRSARDAP